MFFYINFCFNSDFDELIMIIVVVVAAAAVVIDLLLFFVLVICSHLRRSMDASYALGLALQEERFVCVFFLF